MECRIVLYDDNRIALLLHKLSKHVFAFSNISIDQDFKLGNTYLTPL